MLRCHHLMSDERCRLLYG